MNKIETSSLTKKFTIECGDLISSYCYKISEIIEPSLYNLGITPNMITVSRFGLILATVPLVSSGWNGLAATMLMVSYFGDCLDGHFARRYQKVSLIGDYLDHGADVVGYIVIIYLLYPVLISNHYIWSLVLFFLTFTTIIETSCEDRLKWQDRDDSNKTHQFNEENRSLKIISRFSDPDSNPFLSQNMYQNLKILRYFGSGTLFLYLSFLVYYLK